MTDTLPAVSAPALEGVPSNPDVPVRMLAKERFTSREFLEREKQRLWPRVWQMACRVEDVPNPGDFFEYQLHQQSVLIVRQRDGGLRGMYNACRHKGRQLVKGSGSVEEFRCPNHAWTYDLDGSLKYVLSPDEFPCGAKYDLAQARVEVWGGFVFVCLDPDAPPLLEYLHPVTTHLAPYRFEDMGMSKAVTVKLPCNWKVAMDPFIEAYHTAGTHPQLLTSLDDVNSLYDLFGIHSRMINLMYTSSPRVTGVTEQVIFEDMVEQLEGIGFTGLSGVELPEGMSVVEFFAAMSRNMAEASGADLSGLSEDQLTDIHCWLLFPNFCLQATATETLGWRVRPDGDDPDSCLLDQYMLRPMPGTDRTPPERQYFEDWRDSEPGLVLTQDYENLTNTQQGLHQIGFEGVLTASEQEKRIAHLHDVLDRFLEGRPWSELV
jgi:phenylpropionate dioxygenase-like ring-hydroxylating dioxygenase large terminal subunit